MGEQGIDAEIESDATTKRPKWIANSIRIIMCAWLALSICSIGFTVWINIVDWNSISDWHQAIYIGQGVVCWGVMVIGGLVIPTRELWRISRNN